MCSAKKKNAYKTHRKYCIPTGPRSFQTNALRRRASLVIFDILYVLKRGLRGEKIIRTSEKTAPIVVAFNNTMRSEQGFFTQTTRSPENKEPIFFENSSGCWAKVDDVKKPTGNFARSPLVLLCRKMFAFRARTDTHRV